ncbi:MAG: DNA polymerase I [Myxococcota bacterium]
MTTLYLVDGSGYIYRAYHAIKPMKNAAGVPIHAVLGFTRMLLKLIKEHKPAAMAVVFDASKRTFRNDLYAEYKANRQTQPDDLRPQFPLCFEAVDALGLPSIREEGVEADDVIATLACRYREAGHQVVIVSGDKDLMQLVDKDVKLLRYNSRNETEEMVDVEGVKGYFGVPPERVVDVLALMGDTSDNIPGVDGIGEKTASELIATYGSVEGVLSAAPTMKAGKRRDTLVAQSDRAVLSKKLATLSCDLKLDIPLEKLRFPGVRIPESRAFFARVGFKALLSDPMFALPGGTSAQGDLLARMQTPAPTVEEAPRDVVTPDFSGHRTVQTLEDLDAVVQACRQAGRFSVETQTTGLDPMRARLVGISLAWAEGKAAYIPVGHDLASAVTQLPLERVRERLVPLLSDENLRKVAHEAKYHFKVLAEHGFPEIDADDDPMLASYILANMEVHGLEFVSEQELRFKPLPYETVCGKGKGALTLDRAPLEQVSQHATQRADCALRLANVLARKVDEAKLNPLYRELELPLSGVLMRVERRGVLVDANVLRSLSTELRADCTRLEVEAHQLAGQSFNLASPKQLAEVLFDKLQLPVQRRTKTGPSTDMDVLEELSFLHPLPAKVLEHRQLSKLIGTYLDALPDLIHPRTGRIHTSYQQAVAATGRLSSQDPNLQNIPVRDERGRKIRSAFVAPKGRVLMSADYNQIELRILAHVTEDAVLLAAFEKGEDVHARTASEIFRVPISDVTKDQRRSAKTINFGLLYGMSAFGLSQQLRIPRAQAKEYLEAYYQRLPGVKQWQEKTLAEAHAQGLVTTLFGRRRLLPGLSDRNATVRQGAERMATNSPIQGSAADIIKRAMVRLDHTLMQKRIPAQMILQVHDELVLEVEESAMAETRALVREAMEGAAQLRVPMAVDLGEGKNWAEAH